MSLSTRKQIRFEPEDVAKIKERAAEAGITFSEYVRRRALGKRIVPGRLERTIFGETK